jgi:hypothetical protein
MNFAFKYYNWRQAPASRRYTINCCNLFSIARLDCNRSIASFGTSNNLCSGYNAYLEASFVEVVYILLLNAIFSNCILYQLKPVSNNLWVFAFSSLVVVFAVIARLQGLVSLYEVINLALANLAIRTGIGVGIGSFFKQ